MLPDLSIPGGQHGGGDQETRRPGGQGRPNYIGMTMTSIHCRMASHLQGQKSGTKTNPLFRHDRDSHGGQKQKYLARVIAKERGILPLSILEGLYIESQKEGTSMNERNESGRGGLVRLVAARGVS